MNSNDIVVTLHSIQEQITKMESSHRAMIAQQRDSDLQTERLDAKLDSIAQAVLRLEKKLANAL